MSKLITRTFESMEVTLKGLTIDKDGNDIIATDTAIITPIPKTANDVARWLHKNYKGTLTAYKVIDSKTITELRGETPEEFYKHSIPLDPVTRKPIGVENDEDIEVENAEEE